MKRRLLAWVGIIAATAFLVTMGWIRAWISDDGFINVRVIQQLLAGNGPVFNVGERVEVGTSTLWLYLVALGKLFVGFETGWIMVYLGLVLTAVAFLLAGAGAVRLNKDAVFPFGLVVLASLSVMWDFATSGLETSLSFAWLAACWAGLAFRKDNRPMSSPGWLPWLIGLGPLVRPDFALISLGFGLLLLVQGKFSLRSGLVSLGLAVSTPLLYEVFRAGYYGTLVPNTALVKAQSSVDQGVLYLWNLASTYWLMIPAVFALYLVFRLPRPGMLLRVGPVLLGLLHGAFVVYIGGDFMHGRFLLPALFLILLPVAVIPLSAKDLHAIVVVTCAWTVVCVGWMRPVAFAEEIVDERAFYANEVSRDQGALVDVKNWSKRPFAKVLDDAVAGGLAGYLVLLETGKDAESSVRYSTPDVTGVQQVFTFSSIGAAGVAAGTNAYISDLPGLGDPIGSRLVLPADVKSRPGHAYRPVSWSIARWTTVSADTVIASKADIDAARAVLQCGDIPQLVAAVSEPMSVQRFFNNLILSPKLTKMRIPSDPVIAEQELCR